MINQFLSQGQLAKLRQLNQRGMPDQVTILVPDAVDPNAYGVVAQTFTDGATVPCRVRPTLQRGDGVQGGQGRNQDMFLFTLPADAVVGNNYRLRREGVEYEVVGDPTESGHKIGLHVLAIKR
jgi:hypothetical protein